MKNVAAFALLLFATTAQHLSADLPRDSIVRLRNQGIAELENEAPVRAEETFRKLTVLVPNDPLPFANLAIASLRQQKFDEARESLARAQSIAPGDPRLVAIAAEIHHWSGNSEAALEAFKEAAKAAPRNVDFQYSLFREATASNLAEADKAAAIALERLATLRPENLVVMLQLGRRARERGDRSAATAVYLRIQELIWQAPRGADVLLESVLDGLEAGEMDSLRSSALRLENVLKITPMYKEGLRELNSGIQGIPLERFRDEPERTEWGPSTGVRFVARQLAANPNEGAALVAGDLDGDEQPEIVRIAAADEPRFEIVRPRGAAESVSIAVSRSGMSRLALFDLDNDGVQDLLAHGAGGTTLWQADAQGDLTEVTETFGLGAAAGVAATPIDFDIEGDLDIALGGSSLVLLRNSLSGPLEDVSERSLPLLELGTIKDLQATDIDRDGDVDLLVAHASGLTWLDNLRQGRFADRSESLPQIEGVERVVSADLDNDGLLDLVTAGRDLTLFKNLGNGFERWRSAPKMQGFFTALAVFDADNDGRLDIAAAGDGGLLVVAQKGGGFEALAVSEAPSGVTALTVSDLDQDGDLDLIADGGSGLFVLENEGGSRHRHLTVRLRGLNKGNSKNNVFGLGSAVEVKAGSAYQFREARHETIHFGLGSVTSPDLMRVVWPNGVPQNRLQPETNQRIVEEQLLKGSCPFLYADSGEGFEFVTDLLWGAPVGLPAGEGRYLGADPTELVYVATSAPIKDRYELRITEELWEAAFFDKLRLWVVDHPEGTEVASSLRIQPGQNVPEKVHVSDRVRPVVAAFDASGRDVTERVRKRDEIYADGWEPSRYQGVAAETWTFTFDLGEAPNGSVRLLLDGWIFPTDASLNLALAQRPDPQPVPPRMDVETDSGWETLIASTGFPAGKTKTMVIDTPPLPKETRRLRIVSSQWLSWDRIAWTDSPMDASARIRAQLEPATADLRYRGFSALVRKAPNAPHSFDYSRATAESPWLPFPGRYTRYGDVTELLLEADDRSVILGPGDEMAVEFATSSLPPVEPGSVRSLLLESHGWDKDADRNTGAGQRVDPLPFRAMSSYPYPPEESFPDTEVHREYEERWLTRVVTDSTPAPPAAR